MKYAAVHRSYMQRRPAVEAEDATIGAWVRLSVYAADIEKPADGADSDGLGFGRIPDCRSWGDREWLRAVGTDTEGVESAVRAGLAEWLSQDLLVGGYDLRGQRQVDARRKNGGAETKPGKKRGRPRKKPAGFSSQNREETESENEPKASKNPSPLPSLPYPTGGGARARESDAPAPATPTATKPESTKPPLPQAPEDELPQPLPDPDPDDAQPPEWSDAAEAHTVWAELTGWMGNWSSHRMAFAQMALHARRQAKSGQPWTTVLHEWIRQWLAERPSRVGLQPKHFLEDLDQVLRGSPRANGMRRPTPHEYFKPDPTTPEEVFGV